ncbi:hypothetical protein HO133_001229 [Letharia lupina]|uniref:RING-type E3 ubiquitin transferase n=1 Tax=Letharia lupina TaxID=560253 RepID=A0A8H6CEY2_9LECA|nr:uncharacterized protein HO133_001229 [Letharia lupina]KAF6222143.1 hypothetical protein HO133_001229 [Letharia lupina]
MPTIRLLPHQDPRSNRPSLSFPATSRTLPHEDCVIRVGRYSERDINPNPPQHTPSSAPVGFKSKVVSRRHCEFWCSQGQWYIKDVKSSSGTFLNHIRLSQPSAESKPFPVHDGDVVQLGIDFRGGEEMIFRCVKIRVECNRAWQKTINNYNVKTHKQLRDLGKTATKKDSDTTSSHSSECSICLMSIAPCQSLFVAPCSHVWHYKCIRPILNDHKSWPQFLCPNCRAVTDLEADIEDPEDGNWEDANGTESSPEIGPTHDTNDMIAEQRGMAMGGEDNGLSNTASRLLTVRDDSHSTPSVTASSDPTNGANTAPGLLTRRGARRISPPFSYAGDQSASKSTPGAVQFLRPITPTQPLLGTEDFNESALRTPTTEMLIHDGPMTPTNNAGPFVFDGSAGRRVDNGLLGRADHMSSDA